MMAYYPKSQNDSTIKIRMNYRPRDMVERWASLTGFPRSSTRPRQQIKVGIFKALFKLLEEEEW